MSGGRALVVNRVSIKTRSFAKSRRTSIGDTYF
jgi:hypothetical protein